MKRRLNARFWIPPLLLLTAVSWYGCEQKGDISPTGSNRPTLSFIDTVIVEPRIMAPGANATIEAQVLSENQEPAANEDVRFSVNRGVLAGNLPDITLATDSLGRAHTTYTAPSDTGAYLLRTELLSMGEMRATDIRVSRTESTIEGTLTAWTAYDSLYADNGQSSTIIYARLRNSSNNPIGGASVLFSTTLGTVTSPAITDPLSGTAMATLVSSTEIGLARIIASFGNSSDTVFVSFIEPAAAASVVVSTSDPQLTAGQDSALITARVFDANNLPVVDNTLVFFSTDGGTLRDVSSRTTDGIATTMLYPPTQTGMVIVRASVGQADGSVPIEVTAGPVALISVTSPVETLPADNTSEVTITAIVTDAFSNPVAAGTPVSFSAIGGDVLSSTNVGQNGEATCQFRAGLDTGPATIICENLSVQGSATISLVPTEPSSMSFTVNPVQLVADANSQATMRALVLDDQNRPVSNGTQVTFVSQSGQIAAEGRASGTGGKNKKSSPWASVIGEQGSLSAATSKHTTLPLNWGDTEILNTYIATTEDGYAYAILTSPTISGADTLRAMVASLSQSQIMIYIAGAAAQIQVTPSMTEIPADGISSVLVSCRVVDAYGNAVGSGIPVSVTATRGELSPENGVTNTQGVFVTSLLSSRDRGTCAMLATSNTAAGYAEVNFVAPAVSSVNLMAQSTTLLADGITSTMLTMTALDQYGLPVSDVDVNWSAGAGIGSLSAMMMETNELGIATALYTSGASQNDAQQQVTAMAGSHADQVTMEMLGVTISAWTESAQLPADGESITNVFALVRESSSGIAVTGASVYFAASDGAIEQMQMTDGSGIATVDYRASTQPGVVTIACTYGDTLRAQTSLQLTDIEPENIILHVTANSLIGNGLSNTMVNGYVTNESGQFMPNVEVTFVVTGAGFCSPPVAMTNDTGWVFTTYTSGAVMQDQMVTVRGEIERSSEEVTIELRGVTVSLEIAESSIPANGVATAEVTALIRETTSLVGLSGVPVTFGTSLGTIPAQVFTNSSGVALTNLTAATSAGTASVVSYYGNVLSDTSSIIMYQPTAQSVQVTASESSLRADGESTLGLSVVVRDVSGVPLPNAPVTWMTTSGQLQNQVYVTNSIGMATAAFMSAALVNNLNATITVQSGSAQGTTLITQRGVTVNVTAVPEMVIADGSSTSTIQAHVYETQTNVPIDNADVSFGATLGTIVGSDETNESGIAQVTLTSTTTTGTSTVTASFGNTLSDQVQVLFAPSTPTTLSLTASPTVLLADNQSTSTLTAVVTDQNGNPVPNGTQVRFSIPPQSGSLENLRTTSSGVATNVLTSSTNPGAVMVLAWAESNPSVRDSVAVTYTVGPAAVVSLTAQADTLQADGIATDTITAMVTDAVGHPLGNVEVRFSASIGNIAQSRSTGPDGRASVTFSSPTTGTATITALADSISADYTIYLIPSGPNSIQLGYNPNSVGVRGSGRNETLLVTATVLDVNNNPVLDGTPVYFNINNSPGGGDFLSSNGPIPTINGEATVSYNSGTVSGTARIRAVCDGISAVSTEIIVYAGPPFIESIGDGCLSTHMSLAANPCNMFGMDVVGDSVQVVALVGDRYNNPVTPGTAVYFTTSAGVVTTATGYTDSVGFARVTLYGGNPLPTIDRWLTTLRDPNLGSAILCTPVPTQNGVAKVLATSAGTDMNGDSVTVWASTNVIFDYSQPLLYIRDVEVNGDPSERELFIGENALITLATYDFNYWPLVYGSVIRFSSSEGRVYPDEITIGCPGDTSYTVSFFNDLTTQDTDAATPVLIEVDTRQGDAFAFTETFTLRALLPN